MTTYRTLEGHPFDLARLSTEEKAYLTQLLIAHAQNVPTNAMLELVYSPGNPVLKGGRMVTREIADTPFYQVAQDLLARVQIRHGEMAPDPGDDVTTEPLPAEDWMPVAEAAQLKNVSVMAIHKAVKAKKLVGYTPEGERGLWVSRTSLEGYHPSAGKQRAGRIARGVEDGAQE